MAAPTQASIVVKKTFTYRGSTKVWTNRYFLNSTTGPADTAHWTTLSDAIVTAEKAIYASWMTIVETLGYQGGTDLPIFSKSYSTNGTGTFANAQATPGDVAAMVRYSTTARSAKNHPVYLFNWYHGALGDSTSNADVLNPAQKTALTTYAGAWVTGFSDGAVTFKKAGPRGAVAQDKLINNYLRHRDFLA
jgi:hypothetical protein